LITENHVEVEPFFRVS